MQEASSCVWGTLEPSEPLMHTYVVVLLTHACICFIQCCSVMATAYDNAGTKY